MKNKRITTASGRPVQDNENSLTVGPRGPILLQDHFLQEKLAHFNRERIPERVVHAKGSGAYGEFVVNNDITRYTRAKLFSQVGNCCRVMVRFSTVTGERGTPDTDRDPRGFAIKFYTEEGNWDLVGNNTPVFFIKDPMKFPDFIHSQKRDPQTNLRSATTMWDFFSLNPESLHQVIILFSERGTPYSYRHMHGFGCHTFSMINEQQERTWVKFHLKTMQGVKNFTAQEAEFMKGRDPDWAQRDLVTALRTGDYPKWKMQIQVMSDFQCSSFRWNPFDPTKIWPKRDFPLMDVGTLTLKELPENYFAEVEQAAFSPSNVVDGISFSPDRLLQGRILAYPDAQRHRLGANYEQIPVNRPVCPVHNHERDGAMSVTGNGGAVPNYSPNSFNGHAGEKHTKEPALLLDSNQMDTFNRNENDTDHYSQPRWLYHTVMTPREQTSLINNLIESMRNIGSSKREEIIVRQLNHFYLIDNEMAMRIAEGLSLRFVPS